MGTTTGFQNINIFEIPDMRSFEELLLVEALEVINIWDIFDMGWQANPQCSPFVLKVPKNFGVESSCIAVMCVSSRDKLISEPHLGVSFDAFIRVH